MSNTTFNEEKNCPAYFKYEGKVYQCVGNDDNQFWAIIDGESKGFEQSNCIVLQVKKDFNVTHLSFGLPILVNGELCTVDHIKPFDFSSTVKDGFVIVFDSENGILETEETDTIEILTELPTPSKELIHEYFDNCSTRPAASIESKELKSAAKVITEQIGIRLDAPKQTPMDKGECIVCMEAYASQLHPSPTPAEDGKQGGEVKTDKIKLKLEYKVIHIDGSDEYGKRQSYSKEAELLNDMGNEGWELVSVTASSINYNVYYYFKQSKT